MPTRPIFVRCTRRHGRTSAVAALVSVLIVGCSKGGSGQVDPGGSQGPGIEGTLQDEMAQAIGNVAVLACMSTTCLFGESDPMGHFTFEIDPPADVALKTGENLTATPPRAALLLPVQVIDSSTKDLGTLRVPTLLDPVSFGPASTDPQVLTVGDGLTLTLRLSDLAARPGDTLLDAAARRLPSADQYPLIGVSHQDIEAVYALHPFAATSASPIGVRAESNLPAGTAVTFRTVSELDGHLSAPASGHADGTFVSTDVGSGITELSYLVITKGASNQ